jgi:hypothetical protein
MFVGFFFHIRNRLEQRGGARRSSAEERGGAARRRNRLEQRASACLSACLCCACLCSACLRPRVCLQRDSPVSACLRPRVCVCVAVWEGSVAVRVVCRVLRPLRTPGRARAGAVARVPFGRCHIHALRATSTSASRFEVRGRRVCRTSCVCVCGLMLSSVCFAYFAYVACRPNSVAERGTHTQR